MPFSTCRLFCSLFQFVRMSFMDDPWGWYMAWPPWRMFAVFGCMLSYTVIVINVLNVMILSE